MVKKSGVCDGSRRGFVAEEFFTLQIIGWQPDKFNLQFYGVQAGLFIGGITGKIRKYFFRGKITYTFRQQMQIGTDILRGNSCGNPHIFQHDRIGGTDAAHGHDGSNQDSR